MKKILAFLLYIFSFGISSSVVEAAIWGPSNYDECVADIVKSAKNSDYHVAQNLCRNQFPKLTNLSKRRNVELACEDVQGKFVYLISVTNGVVSVKDLGKATFETTAFTKESIIFRSTSKSKGAERKVTIYGKIDAITAFGNIVVEFDDKKSPDFVYEFNCLEKK
jgi:hypothetical protein